MIKKRREIPLRILQNEALLRRLPIDHWLRPVIKADLNKRQAGYKGEKELDRYLDLLVNKELTIFHDLRLPHNSHYFQIDTLILTTKFALILEVKNIFGTLEFDLDLKQMIRKVHDKEEGFLDPISQVKTQGYLFQKWLKDNRIINYPIIPKVVISNPSTIIKSSQKNLPLQTYVTHLGNLFESIIHLKQEKREKVENRELKRIGKLLNKQHTPLKSDLLKMYDLKKEEIQTGVLCPNCLSRPMIRKNRNWLCLQCQYTCKHAHEQSIRDYFLLINPTITNQEARKFLHLSSSDQTYYLLTHMNLSSSGANKNKIYYRE